MWYLIEGSIMSQYVPWALTIIFFVAFLYERKRRREAEKREKEAKKKHQSELIAKLEEVNVRFTKFEQTVKERLSASQDRKDYPMFFND